MPERSATIAPDAMELHYARVVRAVADTPWAITPHMLALITDLVAFRAAGNFLTKAEIRDRIAAEGKARAETARVGAARSGDVAVIPLHGVITPYAGMFTDVSGMAALDRFRARFREALSNEQVGSILVHIDSPGGSVALVEETARELFGSRGQKRLVGISSTLCASAAYWIGAQLDELVVTPSGEVGSVGVYAAHVEYSKKLENAGVTPTLIRAGKFKAEGNPYEPLSDEARAAMQTRVNDCYDMFVKAVARGRGVNATDVRNGFGEGRVVGAAEAVRLGMADRVATFEDTLARMRNARPSSQSRRSLAFA